MRNILSNHKQEIASGTYTTMLFNLNELELEMKELKHYKSSASVVSKIAEMNRDLVQLSKNHDPFEFRRGMFRRAFISGFEMGNT